MASQTSFIQKDFGTSWLTIFMTEKNLVHTFSISHLMTQEHMNFRKDNRKKSAISQKLKSFHSKFMSLSLEISSKFIVK